MAKRWSIEEDDLLKNIHNGKTYTEIAEFFPNRTRLSIEARCQNLGYNKNVVDERFVWTKEKNKLLEKYYPICTMEELLIIFPNQTEGSISTQAGRLKLHKEIEVYNAIRKENSHKATLCWNNEKTQKLISEFTNGRNVYESFSEHTSTFIRNKLIEFGLLDKTELQLVQDVIGVKDYNSLNLNDVLKIYKKVLNNEISGFSFYQITNEQIIFCFKYFLLKNNIDISKDFFLNVTFGEILENAKLKARIKSNFSGYFDFISLCFPKFKFKEWEFKNLNVSDGFWKDKINCFRLIDSKVNNLIENNIIKEKIDILGIPLHQMRGYLHHTLITYYSHSIIFEYLDFYKIDYSSYSNRIYENQLFDSKEELLVYKKLQQHFPNIKKCKKRDRVFNKDAEEGYIPDFLIGDDIVIEYFGLYKNHSDENIYKDYVSKAHRKNDFYKKNYNFYLDIYPNDLSNNLEGLNGKIENLKLLLEGGEIIGKTEF